MRKWENLKVLNGCLTVFSVSCIIGLAFGFAKYYGVPVFLTEAFALGIRQFSYFPQLTWA